MKAHFLASTLFLVACGSTPATPAQTPPDAGNSNEPQTPPPSTVSGQDELFVVNGGDGTLSVIDASSRAVTHTYPLGVKFPHHVSVSPDGSTLLVAVPGMDFSMGHNGLSMDMMKNTKGAIVKVNAATGAVITTKSLNAMNHNAAFSPNGQEIWTSQMNMPGSVLVLSPDTLSINKTIAVDHMPAEVTFSVDGKFAFVANEMTDDVSVIDVNSKQVVKTIKVGQGPVGAWPASNDVMYVDNEQGKSLTPIDAKTQGTSALISLGFTPGMVAMAPDGGLWVTNEDAGAVAIFDTKTGKQTAKVATDAGAHGIVFSADGKTAYVSNQLAGNVSVIDVASRTVVKTVAVGTKPNGMVYRVARAAR